MKKDKSLIPKGLYCYDGGYKCPYWEMIEHLPHQESGYCHFLEEGDYESEHLSLLWDQCKECGINDDIEDEDWYKEQINEKWYTDIFGTQIRFVIDTFKEIYKEYKNKRELKKMIKGYKEMGEEDVALANEGIEDWSRMLDEIDKE